MKKIILFLCVLLTLSNLNAQSCSCNEELKFVVEYYELNLPGFKDDVTEVTREKYEILKTDLEKDAIDNCNDKQHCFKLLTTYVEFFNDNHSSIRDYSTNLVNEEDSSQVSHFLASELFLSREKIDFKGVKLPKNKINNLLNSYKSEDGVYTVVILPSKTSLRDFIGVIIDSKSPLWQKGQVKFELKQLTDSTFNMFLFARNHSLRYYKNILFKNGILGDDYVNIKLKDHHFYHKEVEITLDFKEFDAQTNYMRIPTFSGNWIAKLDSFYRVNHPKIISKQNLIIDVRNNGGGSDAAAFQLLDYIYSKPFFSDQVDLYVTKENIRKSIEWYEENKSDTINFDKEFMSEILAEIERMKTAPLGSFISRFERQEIVLDSVSKLPSKIYILQNRYCASTCESLLFCARESDKVIRLGENSGGYVGYGEISKVKTPIYNFDLGCTMTRFVNQRSYEQTGIPPDIYLDYQSDWLEQVKKYLK